MSQTAKPGWYVPEGSDSNQERYWDGESWTARLRSRNRFWFHTWWAIAIGFALCILPGVLLLWTRPLTSKAVKTAVTVVAVPVLLCAPALLPSGSDEPEGFVSNSSPTPSQVASTSATPTSSMDDISHTTALSVAMALPIGDPDETGNYSPEAFGAGWIDVDENGCDTRNDILARDLNDTLKSGPCTITAGTLHDDYSGEILVFDLGEPEAVNVDRVVSLSDAWSNGAQNWDFAKRVAFANDPLNLLAVGRAASDARREQSASSWLPSNDSFACEFVARQVAVKDKYRLRLAPAEADVIIRVLGACDEHPLPDYGTQSVVAANLDGQTDPLEAPPSAPAPTPAPSALEPVAPLPVAPAPVAEIPAPAPVENDPDYGTCKEAIAHGAGPYVQGVDPEYGWYRDSDSDGVVCER